MMSRVRNKIASTKCGTFFVLIFYCQNILFITWNCILSGLFGVIKNTSTQYANETGINVLSNAGKASQVK